MTRKGSETNGFLNYKKNTVTVTADGEVWGDPALTEQVRVQYNVTFGRFVGKPLGTNHRFTIVNA